MLMQSDGDGYERTCIAWQGVMHVFCILKRMNQKAMASREE